MAQIQNPDLFNPDIAISGHIKNWPDIARYDIKFYLAHINFYLESSVSGPYKVLSNPYKVLSGPYQFLSGPYKALPEYHIWPI